MWPVSPYSLVFKLYKVLLRSKSIRREIWPKLFCPTHASLVRTVLLKNLPSGNSRDGGRDFEMTE